MNYVENAISLEESDFTASPTIGLESVLDKIESQLYRAEKQQYDNSEPSSALDQLTLIQNDSPLTHPDYLSKRTQKSDKGRIEKLIRLSNSVDMFEFWDDIIDYIAALIDLHQPIQRK